jgi:hypothetical protein
MDCASAAKLLSKDEARRIAANIAKLPQLLRSWAVQSFIWTSVGVFFLDAPGDGTNSDHSLFDGTCADVSSAAGRGRGNGDEWRPARCLLALLPATWFSHVVKSWAIADRGDGASLGEPLMAACAGAKTDSKKNREKLAVLNTLAFIIFAPAARSQIAHYEATRN